MLLISILLIYASCDSDSDNKSNNSTNEVPDDISDTKNRVATPVIEFIKNSGKEINAKITCATEGAEIYYTIDGSDPLTCGIKYTSEISVTGDGTFMLKVIAIKETYTPSLIITKVLDDIINANETYTVTFDLDGGVGTAPLTQRVKKGEQVTKPLSALIKKDGYESFNTNSGTWLKEDKSVFDFTNDVITSDTVLKPKWVAIPLESLTLNEKKLVIMINKSAILTAEIKPTNVINKTITWTSSDTSIIEVSENGTVTAKNKEGHATISATIIDGDGKEYKDSCDVTVTSKQVIELSDTSDFSSIILKAGEDYIFTGEIKDDDFPIFMKQIPTTGDAITMDFSYCGVFGSMYQTDDNPNGFPGYEMKIPDGSKTDSVIPKNAKISQMSLPYNIKTIPMYFAAGNTTLKSVTTCGKIKTIEWGAFNSCVNLASVNFGDQIKSIENGAFAYCAALNNFTIPGSIKSISDSAFYNCKKCFTNLVIPNTINDVEWAAFYGCGVKSITAPGELMKNIVVGNTDTLQSAIITQGSKSIQEYAFNGAALLTSVIIPDSVTSIEESAFSGCTALTSVAIPNSVTSIEKNTFSDCSAITSITIPNSISEIKEGLFSGCTALISVTISNNVTIIEKNAFENCTAITTITIPNSVSEVGISVFKGWGNSQTIIVPWENGSKPAFWESYWDDGCNAQIIYNGGN